MADQSESDRRNKFEIERILSDHTRQREMAEAFGALKKSPGVEGTDAFHEACKSAEVAHYERCIAIAKANGLDSSFTERDLERYLKTHQRVSNGLNR